jgi:hypothetical protein
MLYRINTQSVALGEWIIRDVAWGFVWCEMIQFWNLLSLPLLRDYRITLVDRPSNIVHC